MRRVGEATDGFLGLVGSSSKAFGWPDNSLEVGYAGEVSSISAKRPGFAINESLRIVAKPCLLPDESSPPAPRSPLGPQPGITPANSTLAALWLERAVRQEAGIA